MGLTDRIVNALSPRTRAVGGEDAVAAIGMIAAGRNPPRRGTLEYLKAYSTMPWLRAVTSRIGNSVASTSWRLFVVRRGGEVKRRPALQRARYPERGAMLKAARQAGDLQEIDDHPLLDLLADPNPVLEGMSARKLTQVYLDLVGEAFWVLAPNAQGMPVEAWPIPPTWVRSTPTAKRPYYEIRMGTWSGEIAEEDVLAFRDPDPVDPYTARGTGTALALADELETDEYAAKHTRAVFYNRARPDMIVAMEGAHAEEVQRFERSWLNDHQGFWRAFKPLFTSRKLDITELTQNFEQLQLTSLRKFERDTIIQGYGMPAEILGITETSNRATVVAADFLYSRWVLTPRLELLRSIYQERLVPLFDERLIIDYVSPVQEDAEHLLNVAKAAPWALTADEWREMQDLEALDDDKGQVHMVPFNLMPMTDLTGGTPAGGEAGIRQRAAQRASEDPRVGIVQAISDRIAPEMVSVFEETVEAHRAEIDMAALEAAVAAEKVAQAEYIVNAQGLAEALWGERFGRMRQPFADADGTLLRLLGASMEMGGDTAAEALAPEIAIEFELANPHAVAWAERHAAEMVVEVSTETEVAIREVIARTLADRRAPAQAAREIRELVGLTRRQAGAIQKLRAGLVEDGLAEAEIERQVDRAAARALRERATSIARTETMRGANAGQRLLWEQAVRAGELPPETEREWLTAEDERVDAEVCAPLNGQTAVLGESFSSSVGSLTEPPAHPRCRCATALVIGAPAAE